MAELGFFGMLVPEDWDGNASGYLSYAVALRRSRPATAPVPPS